MKKHFLFFLFLLLFLLPSCNDGPQLKQNVSGKTGEVVVVMNKGYWEAGPGQALRSILAVDFPHLPQREPLFSLFNIQENAFSSLFQVHRNIILCHSKSELSEAKIVIQRDIWAAPQIVITISGPDEETITACIDQNSDLLKNALEQAERNRVIQNSKKYEEVATRKTVLKAIGGSPYFPIGYRKIGRASCRERV